MAKKIGKMIGSLSAEIQISYPRVVLQSNCEVLIEGCKKIMIYEENMIRVKTKKLEIAIYGTALNLVSINPENVLITGTIDKLEYFV